MSKQLFRSHNKVGETMSFKTNSPDTTTFDPVVGKDSGRVSWDLGNGSGYTAGNSISHIYSGDTGTTKTVTLRTNLLSTLTSLNLNDDNIVGRLDMSGWSNLFQGDQGINVSENSSLTGITHTYTPHPNSEYVAENCDLTGTLDLRPLGDMSGDILLRNNTNLTHILFTGGTGGGFNLLMSNCDLTGNLDLSGFQNFYAQFDVDDNINLTGITFYTGTSSNETQYFVAQCPNYSGIMDLRGLKLRGFFAVRTTPLTAILHGPYNGVWANYWANLCNITGNHDLSMFPTLGGELVLYSNTNLTGITHTASTAVFTKYDVQNCNLIGNLDVSMFPNLGTTFRALSNSNLTSVTHTASPLDMNLYLVNECDLTGNHDMTWCPNLGNTFNVQNNPNLTGVTHTANNRVFNSYYVDRCDLTGIYDVSMFTGLGGIFQIFTNPNLSGITHTASTEVFSGYWAYTCDLRGNIDVSMLTGLGGVFKTHDNSNLTGITFPYTTQTFANQAASSNNWAFSLKECDLGFVNFLPLSGITMDVGSINGASIGLNDNNMTVAEVNHILFNFYELNNTYSQPGWTGVTLDISGTNAAPDATGGGYDGTTSQTRLVNDYGWTITSN